MLNLARRLAAGLAASLCFSVVAVADDWMVQDASGAVQVVHPRLADATAQGRGVPILPLRGENSLVQRAAYGSDGTDAVTALYLGDPLEEGAILTTGGDGQVVLMRGEQQITVGPNARMSLPGESAPGMTRILQDAGALLFRVDKRQEQHFIVETPVLAAVVKGTTFTVSADPNASVVHVVEGLVEVRARQGNQIELVPAGATAIIDARDPTTLHIEGAGGDPAGSHGSFDSPSLDGDVPAGRRDASLTGPADWVVPAQVGGDAIDYAGLNNGLIGGSASSRAAGIARSADAGGASADRGAQAAATTITNPQAGVLPPTANATTAEVAAAVRAANNTGLARGVGNGNDGGSNNAGGNGNGAALGLVDSDARSNNAGGNGNGNALGLDNAAAGSNNAGGLGNLLDRSNANSASNNAGGNGNALNRGNANSATNNAGGNGNGNNGRGQGRDG